MISYKFTQNELPLLAQRVGLTQAKTPFIISGISLPFTLYFLIIGIFFDAEALRMGFPTLFISIFMFIVSMRMYLVFKSVFIKWFDNESIDGIIECKIEKDASSFSIKNLLKETKFVFKATDIYSITYDKNVIVVKLRTPNLKPKLIVFPNTQELKHLFKNRTR